jgi:histidinol-phosphatase (PHP family)
MPLDYLKIAMVQGCTELGFSDHCPYPADGYETWSFSRMDTDELPVYVQAVRDAQAHSPFPVRLGFECEWSPHHESWFREVLLGEYKAEYLVFGPHWLMEGHTTHYAPEISGKAAIRRYFDFTIAGIRSGLFSFIAHPDLIMAGGMEWNPELKAGFSDLIDAAKAFGLPLEINGYGMVKTRVQTKTALRLQYPVDNFWQLAVKKNAPVICNSDAHNPNYVMQGVVNTRRYAVQFGMTPIDTIFC